MFLLRSSNHFCTTMPKFSIILSTWNRANILPKTLTSILNQTFEDFELLIMDDGSTDGTGRVLKNFINQDGRVKIFRHEKSRERIISWNELMKEAKGEWLYFVDSDDEISYGALEILNHNINLYPDFKVFNFGQMIYFLGHNYIKEGKELPDWSGEGMYHFDSGLVGTGGFMFKRECMELMPDIDNVYDFADWFGAEVNSWFENNDPDVPHTQYNKDDKFVGNPWGQDNALMWLVTRKHKSKMLPICVYIAYVRTEDWLYDFNVSSGTMG